MNYLRALFLLTMLGLCTCKTAGKTAGNGKKSESTGWATSLTGYERADSVAFTFDTIPQQEFDRYRKNYRSKTDSSQTRILKTAKDFSIITADSTFTFPADTNDYSQFAYYDGFLAPLNLYMVTAIDGDNETGTLFLIDHRTSKKYYLGSSYDDPAEPPLLSPKNNYMIAVANDSYTDNDCEFQLIRIRKNKRQFLYETIGNFTTSQWKIAELVWISERAFALRAITTERKEESGEEKTSENYLRVSF